MRNRGRSTRRVGPLAGRPEEAPHLDIDALLDDPGTRIIVCTGSGGVGKTTTSAALALRAAERGRKVVVLTIDPARRLAQSMGIESLDNIPRPVPGVQGEGHLDAMMLVGLRCTPADGLPPIRAVSHYVCAMYAGNGAFREVAEGIINAKEEGSREGASR